MKKLEEAKGDFGDGEMKKVLSRQVKNIKDKLKSKAESEIKKRLGLGSDEEEFKLQNLRTQAEQKARDAYQQQRGGTPKIDDTQTADSAEDFSSVDGAVETNIGKQSIGGLDKDIQDNLSKNPSTDEINDAILKQSNRNGVNELKEGRKLPTKDLGDDMSRTQTEGGRIRLPKLGKRLSRGDRKDALKVRQKGINEKFSDLSEEDKSSVLKDLREAKDNTQTFRKSGQDPLTQQENEMGMKENIIDNYSERQKQLSQSAETETETIPKIDEPTPPKPTDPSTDTSTPPIEEPPKPKVNADEDEVKGFKDTEKVAGDIEEMGGGPEDPITDIISLILGGVGLYGGIKASEKVKADDSNVPPPINVSSQFGVN